MNRYAMKYISTFFLLAVLAGCSSQGKVQESVSKFDGTQEVTMKRIGMKHIEIGAYWNSNMKQDEVFLIAGRRRMPQIKGGLSLHFNIDGEFVDLMAVDESASMRFNYQPFSFGGSVRVERRFVASRELIKRLIASKELAAKVDLMDGGSVTSDMVSRRVDLRRKLDAFMAEVEKKS